jgi:hypothetical protein
MTSFTVPEAWIVNSCPGFGGSGSTVRDLISTASVGSPNVSGEGEGKRDNTSVILYVEIPSALTAIDKLPDSVGMNAPVAPGS